MAGLELWLELELGLGLGPGISICVSRVSRVADYLDEPAPER